MGSFYTTIAVGSVQQEEIRAVVGERRAFMSPPAGGFTVLYPDQRLFLNPTEVMSLCSGLSATVCGPVMMAMVHDDDIMYYWLWTEGALVDRYISDPSYYEPHPNGHQPYGGDALELCRVFDSYSPEALKRTLYTAHGQENRYVFETDRHRDLVRLLGLPLFSAGIGFEYIEAGEVPEGLKLEQLGLMPEGM